MKLALVDEQPVLGVLGGDPRREDRGSFDQEEIAIGVVHSAKPQEDQLISAVVAREEDGKEGCVENERTMLSSLRTAL